MVCLVEMKRVKISQGIRKMGMSKIQFCFSPGSSVSKSRRNKKAKRIEKINTPKSVQKNFLTIRDYNNFIL